MCVQSIIYIYMYMFNDCAFVVFQGQPVCCTYGRSDTTQSPHAFATYAPHVSTIRNTFEPIP